MSSEKRGFAGLKSSVSDTADSVPEPLPEKAASTARTSSSQLGGTSSNRPEANSADPGLFFKLGLYWGGLSLKAKLIWGLIFIGIAWNAFDLGGASKPKKSSNSASYYSSTTSQSSGTSYSASSLAESMPSAGTGNVLNASEILYCMAEQTRIDAHRGTLDSYNSYSVSRFNASVRDYNARCGQYRYKRSAYSRAQAVHDANRSTYVLEGMAR
jgi:hypothetical protein